jgi:hypothetical protein
MHKTVELQPGDPCPSCDGTFKPMRVPTDEQRARFEDRDIREPFPPGTDTANKAQREQLGALYVCRDCGYQTRFPIAADKP